MCVIKEQLLSIGSHFHILGIELRLSNLVANTFTPCPPPFFSFFLFSLWGQVEIGLYVALVVLELTV